MIRAVNGSVVGIMAEYIVPFHANHQFGMGMQIMRMRIRGRMMGIGRIDASSCEHSLDSLLAEVPFATKPQLTLSKKLKLKTHHNSSKNLQSIINQTHHYSILYIPTI